MPASLANYSPTAGKAFHDHSHGRIQALRLCYEARAEFVSQAPEYEASHEVHLCNRRSAILSKEGRTFLHRRDRGLQQVGKENREQQNEEGTVPCKGLPPRAEKCYGGDYIPRTIIE